jgi:hypothetical protein
VYRVNGDFINGPLIGASSNAVYQVTISSDFTPLDNPFEDIIDNNRIQQESSSIIDWSESNPFGEP